MGLWRSRCWVNREVGTGKWEVGTQLGMVPGLRTARLAWGVAFGVGKKWEPGTGKWEPKSGEVGTGNREPGTKKFISCIDNAKRTEYC